MLRIRNSTLSIPYSWRHRSFKRPNAQVIDLHIITRTIISRFSTHVKLRHRSHRARQRNFLRVNGQRGKTAAVEELSFKPYKELAEQHNGAEKLGYRQRRVLDVVAGTADGSPKDVPRSERAKRAGERSTRGI